MSHIPKRKPSNDEDDNRLIVDLSAIPPQSDKPTQDNPLAGLMPLPQDTSTKSNQNPLAGLVSPPPDSNNLTKPGSNASAEDSPLHGIVPPDQPPPQTGDVESTKK